VAAVAQGESAADSTLEITASQDLFSPLCFSLPLSSLSPSLFQCRWEFGATGSTGFCTQGDGRMVLLRSESLLCWNVLAAVGQVAQLVPAASGLWGLPARVNCCRSFSTEDTRAIS